MHVVNIIRMECMAAISQYRIQLRYKKNEKKIATIKQSKKNNYSLMESEKYNTS